MSKRVVIFIDGQNLYHSLRSIKLREIDIDFEKIFNDCLEEEDELIRTYLFRPEKVQDFYIDKRKIACNILEAQEESADRNELIERLTSELNINFLQQEIKSQVEEKFNESMSWLKSLKQQFSQTDYKYTKLSDCYTDFTIVKKGVLKVDPYNQRIIGEKGVDVALSVNMVKMSLTDKLDKIILFSGDYDYSEGIIICKDNMNKVHIVKIHRGYPPKNISSSRDLLSLADKVINIYESDLSGKYAREDD